jgi:hypothetical protein
MGNFKWGEGGVLLSTADDSSVITGLASSQGKPKLDAVFHLVSHPWLKHESNELAWTMQKSSGKQVQQMRFESLVAVNIKITSLKCDAV